MTNFEKAIMVIILVFSAVEAVGICYTVVLRGRAVTNVCPWLLTARTMPPLRLVILFNVLRNARVVGWFTVGVPVLPSTGRGT